MNPLISRISILWRRMSLLCLAGVLLLGLANPLAAAQGGRKLLKLTLSEDRRSAEVQVPRGYGEVTLQRFHRDGGWQKFARKDAASRVVKFELPATGKDVRWRAVGRFEIANVSRDKFPPRFYEGDNRFGPLKTSGGSWAWPYFRYMNLMTGMDGIGSFPPPSVDPAPGGIEPVEADIWKTDGNTVYFFNQLRGLQVLDVSNPADPRLTASLRLPAAGEDLYLLPGSGETRFLVLLTRVTSDSNEFMTRINLVKVTPGQVAITHREDVPGNLEDSRMVGDHLILATSHWSETPAGIEAYPESFTKLTQWRIAPGSAPQRSVERVIPGENPLIAAGAEWLAVAVNPPGEWNVSEVSVFTADGPLFPLTREPLRTAGAIADKFKIQWSRNVLTTISEKNGNDWSWSPTTVLENFRVWGPDVIRPAVIRDENPFLGKLELAEGESLFATRFAGDKAYVVTFLQTDPLWVVDLSDAQNPKVSGHLEVPGWSSHIQPIGDLLLAIGWESNTVAASLFDVADPASPTLLRRLKLGAPGSYSEASWDEQALKVLPDAGLAMIPLTSYDEVSGTMVSGVQLLDLDLAGGDLKKRGLIAHDFDARRSELIGDAVISVSQRAMVAADVSDRNHPKVLAEVSLAWPVDRVLAAGGHLIQIEAGANYGYGRATARVSRAKAPEEVLSETDLGEGVVRAADYREGKLFILREIASSQPWYRWSPVIGRAPDKLILDIYDAYSLPALSPLGSCTTDLKDGMQVTIERLLWPQPNRPVVALNETSSFWYGWDRPIIISPPILIDPIVIDPPDLTIVRPLDFQAVAKATPAKMSIAWDPYPYVRPHAAPRILVFDTSNPAAPTAGQPIRVGTAETSPSGVCEAADGLVVIGASDAKNEATGEILPYDKAFQSVHVIEVGATGNAVVRPGIDLPGELFAIADLDARGFLAYTRNSNSGDAPALKVSACDGYDAFEIAALDEDPHAVVTAGGRRLFVAKPGGVARHRLSNEGAFESEAKLDIGWQPEALRWTKGILLGNQWNRLFAAEASADTASRWRFPAWSFQLDRISVTSDSELLIPFGEYGAGIHTLAP